MLKKDATNDLLPTYKYTIKLRMFSISLWRWGHKIITRTQDQQYHSNCNGDKPYQHIYTSS